MQRYRPCLVFYLPDFAGHSLHHFVANRRDRGLILGRITAQSVYNVGGEEAVSVV